MLVKVALPLPIPALTYSVPSELVQHVRVGTPVIVPLRKKKQTAFVLELNVSLDGEYKVQDIHGIAEEYPSLAKDHVDFLVWLSKYYHYPVGALIQSALPPHPELEMEKNFSVSQDPHKLPEEQKRGLQLRGGKRWELLLWLFENGPSAAIEAQHKSTLQSLIKSELVLVSMRPKEIAPKPSAIKSESPNLQEAQLNAVSKIGSALEKSAFTCFLLEGVTGSGKTEVYLHAAQRALSSGGGVIVLVPEIALTPQLFHRFQSRLQEPIALLHSGLSDRERSRQWQLLQSGRVRIALGARSTILAPVKDLRLIVVDEEHEGAFKQEDRFRYNARDAAILRAKLGNATIVLGSATPSLESYLQVKSGRYELLRLENRVTAHPLPAVEIVDQKKSTMTGLLTRELIYEIGLMLKEKKQTMLLLNRRGLASHIHCESCGFVPECTNCSVSLTLYGLARELRCHYCGYSQKQIRVCPKCSSEKMESGSPGTEALEKTAQECFPEARVLRIDRDSMSAKHSLEDALTSVARGEVDIIIGTQMIAKGHDFPNVGLVGVVNADASFSFPDFRSSERSFQLFTQMAGRAGRGDFVGKVLLQTYQPEHPSVQFSAKHDFRSFAEQELRQRHSFQYPPYTRLARILVSDASDARARSLAEAIAKDLLNYDQDGVIVLGPAPSLLQKLQNRFRWNIILKSKDTSALNAVLKTTLKRWNHKIGASASLSVDVDPSSLF